MQKICSSVSQDSRIYNWISLFHLLFIFYYKYIQTKHHVWMFLVLYLQCVKLKSHRVFHIYKFYKLPHLSYLLISHSGSPRAISMAYYYYTELSHQSCADRKKMAVLSVIKLIACFFPLFSLWSVVTKEKWEKEDKKNYNGDNNVRSQKTVQIRVLTCDDPPGGSYCSVSELFFL